MQEKIDRLRDHVLELFPWLESQLGDDLPDDAQQVLDRARAALASSRYIVLTVGEFKRGKSSLLNALIGQRLFPVDTDVATTTVCTLSWGETSGAVVLFLPDAEGRQVPPRAIDLADVERYATVQGQAELAAELGLTEADLNVAQIDIIAPIPQLQSGLTLVDTPGVGSLNPAHTAATTGFLPEADALLFVASSVQPLGAVELAFLARAYELCPIVLTAVSMIDKTVDESAVIAEVRTRIADVTGQAPEQVDLVGVSALRRWNGEQAGDTDLIAKSGFPELELKLWTGLVGSVALARLSRALDVLQATASDSAVPLRNEQAALRGNEELDLIDEQLRAAQVRASEARAEAPRRSRQLSEELRERARPIRRQLTQSFDDITADFKYDTENREVLLEPDASLNRLAQRMVEAQGAASRALTAAIGEVADRFSNDLPIALNGKGDESMSSPTALSAPLVKVPTNRFATFRSTLSGGSAGTAVGLAAGLAAAIIFPPAAVPVLGVFVAGPLIGGTIGHMLGMIGGYSQGKQLNHQREETERRRRLRDYALPRIEATRRVSLEDIDSRVADEGRALTAALDEQLSLAARRLEESRERLQQARSRTAAQNTARAREVEVRLRSYAEVDRTLARVRHAVELLGKDDDPA